MIDDFDKYLKLAEKRDVAVFVYFTTSWCVIAMTDHPASGRLEPNWPLPKSGIIGLVHRPPMLGASKRILHRTLESPG
jgi:hypothetical protein